MDFIFKLMKKHLGDGGEGHGEQSYTNTHTKNFNGQLGFDKLFRPFYKSPDLKENTFQGQHTCPHKETQQALPRAKIKCSLVITINRKGDGLPESEYRVKKNHQQQKHHKQNYMANNKPGGKRNCFSVRCQRNTSGTRGRVHEPAERAVTVEHAGTFLKYRSRMQ